MKKLLFLVGTRPELIKIAPLLRLLKRQNRFKALLCTSGQHDTLLEDTLAHLALFPELSFHIGGSLAEKTSECMLRFGEVLAKEKPEAVLVHGDTLTAFSGGLAAFYQQIPVFHIEAGLRSGNPFSPFPEELYRRAIDHLSTLHFAPTTDTAERLLREGIDKERIHTVGNTAIDGLWEEIDGDFHHPLLTNGKKLVLLTLHRRESLGAPLAEMLHAVADAIKERTDAHLFFPMHPNPAVRETARDLLGDLPSVTLAEPTDTHTFRNLLHRATLTLTDSGGVSEEATALGTPTLILRDETERPEGVEAGVLQLVGRKKNAIQNAITDHLEHPRPHIPSTVFGDGHSSEHIAEIIEKFFVFF